jgi:hypothetical protein
MDYHFFYKTQFQEVYYIPKTGNITIFGAFSLQQLAVSQKRNAKEPSAA